MLPHRVHDGYGIKDYLIDRMKEQWADLIITVDNGITSVDEVEHAKSVGLDIIITDHHQALDKIPAPIALINPQVSPDMPFKEICGASVAFKLCLQLADDIGITHETKKTFFNDLLPYVAIATVCDCMPLVEENRLIVKKWLSVMNKHRSTLLPSLRGFLEYLNIDTVDSYHMWFMIWPRLNATGRIWSAHDGLDCLLCHDPHKQKKLLEAVDQLNTDRKVTQEDMITIAQEMADHERYILIAAHEEFHEGIVWIVAGRLTNKHNKPSVVIGIDTEKWIASGSLRWPEYFSVIDMLKTVDDILVRYGWHEQAWWLTIDIKNLDELKTRLEAYCKENITPEQLIKHIYVDTQVYDHELKTSLFQDIQILWPYGEKNREPIVLIPDIHIQKNKILWRGERTHLKLFGTKSNEEISIIFWWKWDQIGEYPLDTTCDIIWHIKEDSYNGGRYIHWLHVIQKQHV